MKKGIKKYLGAFMMGAAFMAVPSCTDTWTEHYLTEDSYTAEKSLWELLESREDLSKFCAIVSKANYYRDETHPAYDIEDGDTVYYTFKDVLSANLPITLWAPTNEAMSEEEWQKYEAMAETNAYNLQQQFIGNHIALFRKTMGKTGSETFRLINKKFATVNHDNGTLQNINVIEKNIGARNGLLHIIDSRNEFLLNIYEYIKFGGELETFRKYMVARDTTYFFEDASIEGLPDEYGNPTYVDSVYYQDNMLFRRVERYDAPDAEDAWMNQLKCFNAQLNTEDSAYVMVIPTDNAWEAAVNKLSPLYNYVSTYPRMDKVKDDKTATMDIYGARKSYPTGKGYETVDSLQAVNINMDIISPLVFNVNLQPQHNDQKWTTESFINGGYKNCEYLLTTFGDTIRDIYEELNGIRTMVWSKNSLFEGEGVQRTQKMSNGYAIISNKWNFPRAFYMRDLDIEINGWYDKDSQTEPTPYSINNSVSETWIDQYGRCNEQDYLHVACKRSNNIPKIAFALTGNKNFPTGASVMSGKYDVQIVLVPRWYETSQDGERDTTAVDQNTRLTCTLYFWNESLIGGKNLQYDKQNKIVSDKIEYSGEKVDTITVLTDVEFPVSYQNLTNTFPVLHIESEKISKDDDPKKYSTAFNIDRIILKSKATDL